MKSRMIAAVVNSLTTAGTRYYVNLEKNFCSCPSWRFQKVVVGQRTCKHLEALKLQVAA